MIAVTGTTGKLGTLVLERLLKMIPSTQLVAIARTPEKAAHLAARGVQVRHGDYSVPDTLVPALTGVKRLLLISGNDLGQRVAQHRAVIDAAKAAGVEFIAYTSVLRADASSLPVATEHLETEKLLRKSGIPFVMLRNGWYVENYTENLASPLAHGGFLGAAKTGRIAAATRADYADAAAAVLTTEGHAGKVYELAGDQAFTMADLAREASIWAGRSLAYRDVSADEYRQALAQSGMPTPFVDFFVTTDLSIVKGELDDQSHDLHRLIGRNTTSLREVFARLPKSV